MEENLERKIVQFHYLKNFYFKQRSSFLNRIKTIRFVKNFSNFDSVENLSGENLTNLKRRFQLQASWFSLKENGSVKRKMVKYQVGKTEKFLKKLNQSQSQKNLSSLILKPSTKKFRYQSKELLSTIKKNFSLPATSSTVCLHELIQAKRKKPIEKERNFSSFYSTNYLDKLPRIYIQTTAKNTMITLTNSQGQPLAWASGGTAETLTEKEQVVEKVQSTKKKRSKFNQAPARKADRRGRARSTSLAATRAASRILYSFSRLILKSHLKKGKESDGIETNKNVRFYFKGFGLGREIIFKTLTKGGLLGQALFDQTPRVFNGCRLKKPRII